MAHVPARFTIGGQWSFGTPFIALEFVGGDCRALSTKDISTKREKFSRNLRYLDKHSAKTLLAAYGMRMASTERT